MLALKHFYKCFTLCLKHLHKCLPHVCLWSTLPTPSLYVPHLGPASAFDPPFQHPHCMDLWVQPQPLTHPSNTLTVWTSGSSLSLWPTLPTPSLYMYVPLGQASAFGPPFQHPHNMYLWVQPQPLAHPFQHPHCMYLWVQPQPLVCSSNTLTVHVCTSGSSLSLWSALPTPSLYVPLGPASAFGPRFQHPHCMYLWVQPQPLAHASNTLTVCTCTSGSSLRLWSALPTIGDPGAVLWPHEAKEETSHRYPHLNRMLHDNGGRCVPL